MTTESLAQEYLSLWRTMEVREEWRKRIGEAAKKIIAGRERYAAVEAETGVPWWVIGIIHHLEAGCNFGRHLHNGDPLTARTVQKPRGRPLKGKPPFPWEESAADALRLDKLDRVEEWTVTALAAALERYNGLGYRHEHPDVLSPYLWSGTRHYERGKYAKDGKFSPGLVSEQPGVMPLAAELARLDRSIDLVAEDQDPAAEHRRTPGPPSGMAGTTEGPAAVTVGGVGGWQVSTEVSGAFGKVASSGKPFALGDLLLHLAASPTFWAGLVTVLGCAYWYLRRAAKLRQGV